jgi:hypothetical protein
MTRLFHSNISTWDIQINSFSACTWYTSASPSSDADLAISSQFKLSSNVTCFLRSSHPQYPLCLLLSMLLLAWAPVLLFSHQFVSSIVLFTFQESMSYTPNLHFSRLRSTVYLLLEHLHYSSLYIAISADACLLTAFIILLGFVEFLTPLVLIVLLSFIDYLALVRLFFCPVSSNVCSLLFSQFCRISSNVVSLLCSFFTLFTSNVCHCIV